MTEAAVAATDPAALVDAVQAVSHEYVSAAAVVSPAARVLPLAQSTQALFRVYWLAPQTPAVHVVAAVPTAAAAIFVVPAQAWHVAVPPVAAPVWNMSSAQCEQAVVHFAHVAGGPAA